MSIISIRAVALLVTVLAGLGACSDSQTPGAPPAAERPSTPSQLLDPAEFGTAIKEPGRVAINVHVPFEGRLAGTDLMIPYDEITRRSAALPADRMTPLAVYCKSGNMSRTASQSLAAMGYPDIVELEGGMNAWEARGRPVLQSPDLPR